MNQIIQLLKSSLLYFLGNVLSNVIIFLLLPLYTAYLMPAEYGYYDLIRTYTTFITSIAFMQIHTVLLRFIYDYSSKDKDKPVTNAICIFVISMIITSIALIVLSYFTEIQYPVLVLIFAFSECFQSFYGYIARGYGENSLFAITGVVATLINAISNVIFIVLLEWDYRSLYVAMIIGVFVQCIIIEIRIGVLKKFKIELIDFSLIKKMIIFGVPFSLNIAAYWFLNSYSRVVISSQLGVAQNGIYAVATKFTLVLNLVSTCFILAWQELAFEKGSEKGQTLESLGKYYTKAGNVYLKLLYLGTLLVLPSIRIVYPVIIDKQYAEGINVIPLAIIAMLINIYCSFQTSIFSSIKKNAFMFIASVAGAITNILLVNTFIEQYELLAVNLALIIGFTVNAAARIIILNKYIGFRVDVYEFLKFLPMFALTYFIYIKCSIFINLLWIFIILFFSIIYYRKELHLVFNKIKISKCQNQM